MGQLVRISIGEWSKSAAGCWQFEGDPSAVDKYIVARSNENINSFTSLIREELVIGPECPIGLTYQLPQRMLHGIQSTKQPSNIVTSDDVAFVMSVQEWTNGVQLCITIGARNVAKYQFLCRTPFNIGDFRFLDGSVTEEDHFASLRGLVGEDIIRCSDTLMTQLFSDENLILIYRLSYEIEKARGFPLCETNVSFNYDAGDEEIPDNAEDVSRYFSPVSAGVEIDPTDLEFEENGDYIHGGGLSRSVNRPESENTGSTELSMNGQQTGMMNENVVEMDQSSTGSTAYINLGENSDVGEDIYTTYIT
ncbi:unnamed protein product [Brassica rapa]|uniref:Uncharacterized protein n=1 Tax=Brassica campestris TaxID=3711 RepID=A0A8D9D801_BRACM|nr:unnamed protein product [Brassica rapa]